MGRAAYEISLRQNEFEKRFVMSAFGVGMAIVPFMDCRISEIVEI